MLNSLESLIFDDCTIGKPLCVTFSDVCKANRENSAMAPPTKTKTSSFIKDL